MALQIGGLASGMDINSLVTEMMKAQRTRVDRVQQSRTSLEWKQDAYNEINKSFASFIVDSKKEFGLTTTSSTGVLLSNSVNSMTWLKNAESADTDVLSVTARADAAKGTYNVKVNSLADNWSAASQEGISLGEKTDLVSQFGLEEGDVLNLTIAGEKGNINAYGVVTEGKLDLELTITKGEDVSVKTVTEASLTNFVNQLNGADVGVRASYDSGTDRFFIQTDGTGSSKGIIVEDNSSLSGEKLMTGVDNLLKLAYFDKDSSSYENIESLTAYYGTDAEIDFGAATGIVQNNNSFVVNGINFTLKDVGETTVTVGTDTDSVYEKIKDFVDKYNELVLTSGTKLQEKTNRSFQPLTDEEKNALSETEVELWETKAKSGLLRNDMTIQKTLTDLRSNIFKAVEGEGISEQYNTLYSVGIDFQSYFSSSVGGLLEIDEAKLRTAIETDVDAVSRLFFQEPSSEYNVADDALNATQLAQKRSESGIVRRIYDDLTQGVKEIVSKAGVGENASLYRSVNATILLDFVTSQGSISTIDENINDYNRRIDTLNTYFDKMETRLWNQFTAMEKAISEMNQQSAWLATQMNGGSSNG